MARHASLATDRLDVGWDELTTRLAARIGGLQRNRQQFLLPAHRPGWNVRLRRDGEVLTAVLARMGRHEIPLRAQAELLDLGWGMRRHQAPHPEFVVSWVADHPSRPRLRDRLRGRTSAWVQAEDLQDAVQLLLATIRGPLQVLTADMVAVR